MEYTNDYVKALDDLLKETQNVRDDAVAELASLRAENARLREALEKISSLRYGGVVSASFADIADEALRGEQ